MAIVGMRLLQFAGEMGSACVPRATVGVPPNAVAEGCWQRDVANGDRDGRAPQLALIPETTLSRRNQMKAEDRTGIITGRMSRLQPGASRRYTAKTDQFCVAIKHLPITMQTESREQ